MKHPILMPALLATLGLAACDRPAVVTVPAATIVVPGPAGPPGPAGDQGTTGSQGATGKTGEGTTVIVIPAASSPSN
jgi:hypothetical protein